MSDVYSAMSLLPPINIEVANDKRRRLVDHYHEELGDLRLLQWLDLVEGYEPDYAYLQMFRTDAEKYVLLAALNLVECIAFVGERPLAG